MSEQRQRANFGSNKGMNELTSSIGKGENELHDILNSMRVSFRASGRDTYVRVWGRFDRHEHPVCLYPDALIDDYDYGSGVILVNGGIHRTRGQAERDEDARECYADQRLWVEEMTISDAKKTESVKAVLERHRILRDEYGSPL